MIRREQNIHRSKLKRVSGILCFLAFCFAAASTTHAQTTVVITAGADSSTVHMLSDKTESILKAVDLWNGSGEDRFPQDPGIDSLKILLQKEKLVTGLDTLRTRVVTFRAFYELPRIYMRTSRSEEFPYREVILSFTKDGELVDANLGDPERNFDRILSQKQHASPGDDSVMISFLHNYRQIFNHKNAKSLDRLFTDRAYIVTGLRDKVSGIFTYQRYGVPCYLEKVSEAFFVKGNKIRVRFENAVIYQHPDFPAVKGILARQYWTTTNYSDVGYVYFIVDKNGDNRPRLLARTWQQEPFLADHFPVLYPVERQQVDVISSDTLNIRRRLNAPPGQDREAAYEFPAAAVGDEKEPFYKKKKWWIIGGAAASLVVGSAILLTGHGNSGPWIPIPPGRPASQ